MLKKKKAEQVDDVEIFLRRAFNENFERLRFESGHGLSPEMKEAAWQQALFYWRRLRHEVAEHITETEVKLTLPGCETPKKRKFNIEGVVDIVSEKDRTVMYDVKTHDPEYILTNLEQYEEQLNVYAYIWQTLRRQDLNEAAIISTQFPDSLRHAWNNRQNDPEGFEKELQEWEPIIPIEYDASHIKDTIKDFGKVIDAIEDGQFIPPPVSKLKKKDVKSQTFATRVCRNCDVRFSCRSYRNYAGLTKHIRIMREFYDDYGTEEAQNSRQEVTLDVTPDIEQIMVNL